MSIFKKLFPPITSAKSFAVTVSPQEAHDRVLAALTAGGYSGLEGEGQDIHAEHGNVALFVYGTVSTDISIALLASDADAYPISVDVGFHAIDGGTQVSVNASYIKPVTFMGAPRSGPMSTKWHEACDAAVATVVSSCSDVLV
jgi:hypothetical protein